MTSMKARSADVQANNPSAKQQRLADMDYITIKTLADLLDVPGDNNWRALIGAMPSCRYDQAKVERFGMNASRPDGSPAYAMLQDMSNRGVTYKDLVAALKRMQFDLALDKIGYRESVKITQQPDATPGVEGQKLQLECKATGVPSPSYMWFKDPQEPLPDQTSETLVIPQLRPEDAGRYCCRVQNGVNIAFSAWVEVKVQKPSILQAGSMPGGDIIGSPKIINQPPRDVKLLVNEELRLFVEIATIPGEKYSYQWSCNGANLPYATSSTVYIKNAKVENQGNYFCRVRSEQGGSSLTEGTQVMVIDPSQPQLQEAPMHQVHADVPLPLMSSQQHLPQMSSQQPLLPPAMQQQQQQAIMTPQMHHAQQPTPMSQPPPQLATPLSHHTTPMTQHHLGQQTPTMSQMSHATNMLHHLTMNQEEVYGDPNYAIHQLPPQPPPHFPDNGYQDVMPQGNYYPDERAYNQPGLPPPIVHTPDGMFHNHMPPQHTHVSDGYIDHQPGVGVAPDTSRHLRHETGPVVDEGPGGQGLPPDLDDACYDKVALLIGNKQYQRDNLKLNTPENDTQDMAGVLLSAGFKVVSLVNLNKIEMEMAVKYFETLIGKNVYALFFFAGHGFEHNSKNFMMPVDADVEKNPEQCICAQMVLHTMQSRGAKLSIVLLDMCRINASSASVPSSVDLFSIPQGSGYFVIGFSCSPMERAYEAGAGQELKEEDRDNSIFVSAFKRHLQSGNLKERLDTLLTDAASVVRERGKDFNTPLASWQKPEIRHNLGEKLSLADPIKNDLELDSERKDRATRWQSAHFVPDSVVVGCEADSSSNVRAGELALRLHFEAEHSNVMLVTTELLNGSLMTCEIVAMEMKLIAGHLTLRCDNANKQYRYKSNSQFGYGHDQGVKDMDLMHFKLPDLQKINKEKVILEFTIEYQIKQRSLREVRDSRCHIKHEMDPPLYAKILGWVRDTPSTSPYVQPYNSCSY